MFGNFRKTGADRGSSGMLTPRAVHDREQDWGKSTLLLEVTGGASGLTAGSKIETVFPGTQT
jgi:hypothetical protein